MPAPTSVSAFRDAAASVTDSTIGADVKVMLATPAGQQDQAITVSDFTKVVLKRETADAVADLGCAIQSNTASDPGPSVRADNRTKILAYIAALSGTGKHTLKIPAGDLWTDPLGTVSTINFTLRGEASEYACQHEPRGSAVRRHASRIHWVPTSNNDALLRVVGSDNDATRPGIIRISDIALMRQADYGHCLDFGDPAQACRPSLFPSLIRGINIDRVYIDMGGHYHSAAGNQHSKTFLFDAGSGDYRIDKTDTGHAIRCSAVYDAHLSYVGVRGGAREQILLANCDLATIDHSHGMTGWRHLLVAAMGGDNSSTPVNGSGGRIVTNDGTTGRYTGIQVEHMDLNGVGLFSGVFDGSIESSDDANRTVPCGRYSMPTGVTWSIAAGAEKITFVGLPGGTDPTDYFYPYQLVELVIASTGGKPKRIDWLLTTHVDSTGVYFAGHATTSHYAAAISSQPNTTIFRHFGTCAVVGGGRTQILGIRTDAADNRPGCPVLAFWPQRGSLSVGGTTNGQSVQSADSTQWPVVCQHTAGDAEHVDNFVIWDGSGERPNHPAVITATPQNLRNRKPPAKTRRDVARDKYDYFFTPGRGVISGATWGLKELPYFFIDDPANGNQSTPLYRLSDNAAGLILYHASYPDFPGLVPSIWDFRIWSDGAITNAIRVYNGSTFTGYNSVNGWQEFRLIPPVGTNWVVYGIGEAYVAWIGVKIAPFEAFPLVTSSAGEASTTEYPHNGLVGWHTNTASGNQVKHVRNVGGTIIKSAAYT